MTYVIDPLGQPRAVLDGIARTLVVRTDDLVALLVERCRASRYRAMEEARWSRAATLLPAFQSGRIAKPG
jgi:hypothetical protein